jgi:hypothetical protein
MSDQIKAQIIEKFHFPNENITIAVQNFLTFIIENRRNLITQSGSLVFQQLDQYTGILASHAATDNQTVQNNLATLKSHIQNCNCSSSNDSINSIFVDDNLRNTTFTIDHEVDAMGKLSTIASNEFQKTLDEFQKLFVEYITNLPGILEAIKNAFAEKYSELLIQLNATKSDGADNLSMIASDLWDDLKHSLNVSQDMLEKIKQNITIEELSDADLAIFKQYNIFNDTIVSTITKTQDNLAQINEIAIRIANISHQIAQNDSFNLSLNVLGEVIYNNLTALINGEFFIISEGATALLLEVEQYMGFNLTNNSAMFLADLINFAKENHDLANRIVEAVLTQNFTQVENLAEFLQMKFSGVFNDTFMDLFSENPLEFSASDEKTLYNVNVLGIKNQLNLTVKYHHIVEGNYGIALDGSLTSFFFEVQPIIELQLHIVNELQELFILKQVLTTSVDLINGTLPISYSLNGNFTEGDKHITKSLDLKIQMESLNLQVNQSLTFYLGQNGNATEKVLLNESLVLETIDSDMVESIEI